MEEFLSSAQRGQTLAIVAAIIMSARGSVHEFCNTKSEQKRALQDAVELLRAAEREAVNAFGRSS